MKRTKTPAPPPQPQLTPAEEAAKLLVVISEEQPKVEAFGKSNTTGSIHDWKRSYISSLHGSLATLNVPGIGNEPWRTRLSEAWGSEHRAHTTTLDLRRMMHRLIDRMQSAIATLDRGYQINSLGEVQGGGLEVDRLCALSHYQTEQAANAWYAAFKAGAPVELASEFGKLVAPKEEAK